MNSRFFTSVVFCLILTCVRSQTNISKTVDPDPGTVKNVFSATGSSATIIDQSLFSVSGPTLALDSLNATKITIGAREKSGNSKKENQTTSKNQKKD